MFVRFIGLITILLSGCSTINSVYYESHQLAQRAGIAPLQQMERSTRWVLPRDSSFYVARNNDLAAISSDNAVGLSRIVERALTDHFSAVRSGLYPESLDNSLTSAKMSGSQFVIYPKLLVWDDKLGTWSEIFYSLRNHTNGEIVDGFGLDRAAVQIIILDVASGNLVDFVFLEAGSGLFSLYGDQPAQLILPTLSDFFSQLAVTTG